MESPCTQPPGGRARTLPLGHRRSESGSDVSVRSIVRRGVLALAVAGGVAGCLGLGGDDSDPLADVDETEPESVAGAVARGVYTWNPELLRRLKHENSSAAADAIEEVEEFRERLDDPDAVEVTVQSTTVLSETSEEAVVDVAVRTEFDTEEFESDVDLSEEHTLTVVLRPAVDDPDRWRLWDTGVR